MEDILRTLVQYQTITGDKITAKTSLQYMADYLEVRGMSVAWFSSNGFPSFVATVTPHDCTPAVMLAAHIDVVPATKAMFRLSKEQDRYKGRGVYDMKFGAAAFLQVVDDLKQHLQAYDFGIMITTDEEIGGQDGVKYLVNQGYRPKVCILPDGGDNWCIQTFEKGTQWIKLEATGVTGHASRPWESEHAVEKLLDALTQIRAIFPGKGKKDTLLSVGTIQGGEAPNQSAVHAEAVLDIRLASVIDHARSFPAIARICNAHDVQATLLVDDPPSTNSLTNPYIKAFHDIIADTLGWRPEPSYSYAGTDGRFFAQHGIPCVVVEPPGGGRHAADEWISITGCEQYRHMVRRYIETIGRRDTRPQAYQSRRRELTTA